MKKTIFFRSIPTFFLLLVIFSKQALADDASLRCSPATSTIQVNTTFTVDYVVDTRGSQAFGADINATYDSALLEAVGTQSTPVTAATGWGQPTTNTIDSELGKIHLDYGNSQPAATISASIGQVTFRAKAAGQAQFNFSFFQPNDDTTPGVAKIWGKRDGTNLSNILTDVNNCIYVIEGSLTPTLSPTPSLIPSVPATSYQLTPTAAPIRELPRSGIIDQMAGFLGTSFILITMGISSRYLLRKR